MAYLYRIVLILFFCIPSISHSALSCYAGGNTSTASPDPSQACKNYYSSIGGTNLELVLAASDNGSCIDTSGGYFASLSCTGHVDPPPNCTDGEKVLDQTVDSFSDTPFPPVSCIGGCEVLITKSTTPQIDCGYSSTNNTVGICTYFSTLTGVKDGASCTGSGATLPPPANLPVKPPPCPVCACLQAGKSWGTVNGTTVCVTAGSAGSNPVQFPNAPTTTKDASGNTTNNYNNNTTSLSISSSSSSSGSSGSTSGGSSGSSATVTSTKADGTTTTQTLDNFCQQNPESQYCKQANNGNFSGSCGGGFTCDGDDAVKCAIAQEEYKRNCQLFDNQTTLSTLGNALGSGVDPNASIDPTTHKTTTSLSSSLNEDSHFSGELTDQSVAFGQFGSINLPFSKLNSILSAMGFIVLAFAYIAAVKIVGVN